MFLFYAKAFITDIDLPYERNHFVENASAFSNGHPGINFFPADDWTGMYTEIIQVQVGKPLVQFSDRRLDITVLIVEYHCDDVIG